MPRFAARILRDPAGGRVAGAPERGRNLDETPQGDAGGVPGEAGPTEPPRLVNLALVAGAVVLIGLVAFALYRRSHTATAPPAEVSSSPAPGVSPTEPLQGTPIAAVVPVRLTPEATVIAERYRCVCSCNDPLNVCTCSKTPGSRDMRTYVQELVNQKKSGSEIDAAMVTRYGPGVLVTAATPTPSPPPVRPKR
jgi:Cytochrome C biogenesis protein